MDRFNQLSLRSYSVGLGQVASLLYEFCLAGSGVFTPTRRRSVSESAGVRAALQAVLRD